MMVSDSEDNEPAHVKAMRQKTDLRNIYRQNLLKDLVGSYENDLRNRGEALLLDDTLYLIWWQYMKAAFDYGVEPPGPLDRGSFDMVNDFGDTKQSFEQWWQAGGRSLFEQVEALPLISVEDIDRDFALGDHPKWITVKIPLTVKKPGIWEQLKKILKEVHPGDNYNPYQHARSKVMILPQKSYLKKLYRKYLEVWIEIQKDLRDQNRFPREHWEIARKLKINTNLDPDGESQLPQDAKRELSEQVDRYYARACEIMDGAIRGEFPRHGVED
jgi:hypothetical protein